MSIEAEDIHGWIRRVTRCMKISLEAVCVKMNMSYKMHSVLRIVY
jgi:hypothetical protein